MVPVANMNPNHSSNGHKVEAMKTTKTSNIDEKREKNHQQRYEFCKVCKLNNNQGRCHVYYPKHKKALSLLLSRFLSKLVNEVFFFLKNPFLLRPEHDSLNRLWCVFCDFDIVEYGSSFACENAIAHLASLEHLKEVKAFLWKHGGAVECANSFCISEADLAKWEKKCKSLKAEVSVEASGSSGHQNCNRSFPMAPRSYSCSVNGSVVLHERIGICDGSLHGTSNGQSSSQGLLSLAQISSLEQENEGNVHSGAPPPWFDGTETNELPRKRKPGPSKIVASQVRPLKSSKLNPKRVGAAWAERRKIELELEKKGEVSKQVDADWLPNFGRVWQSGCRKESRKELQVENRVAGKVENEVENPMLGKPYISKRMREDHQVSETLN